jgi:hypothetical protein
VSGDLDTSRGCLVALLISMVLWALVAAVAWMATR